MNDLKYSIEETKYLENTNIKELNEISERINWSIKKHKGNADEVTVQFTFNQKTIVGILGFVYSFIMFGKNYFFPDGVFRKPKFIEIGRNFQMVVAIIRIFNSLIALWKDENKGIALIEIEARRYSDDRPAD